MATFITPEGLLAYLAEVLITAVKLGGVGLCIYAGVLLGRRMTRHQTTWFVTVIFVAIAAYLFALVELTVTSIPLWQLWLCAIAAAVALSANAVHEPEYRTYVDY